MRVCVGIVGRKVSGGWHERARESRAKHEQRGGNLDVFDCAGVGAWVGGGHVTWV